MPAESSNALSKYALPSSGFPPSDAGRIETVWKVLDAATVGDAIRRAAELLLRELGAEASLDEQPAPPPELRENKLLDDFMGGM